MRKIITSACIFEGDDSFYQGSVNALNSLTLLNLKQQRCDQAMRPIKDTWSPLQRSSLFMTSPGCSEKYTQIFETVGVPTLVINRPRTGESRSFRDFTNELITFREFISLNLALSAASGIDFPCSSFCIWLICREGLQPCFPSFPAKLSFLLDQRKIIPCLPVKFHVGKDWDLVSSRLSQSCHIGGVKTASFWISLA